MTKLTQYKWLVVAICFLLGKPGSFGAESALQQWINNLPVVKEAKQNSEAYSQKINMSSEEVNKIGEQMDKNLDGAAAAAQSQGISPEQARADLQKALAVRWNTQKNVNILLPQAQAYRDGALKQAYAQDKKDLTAWQNAWDDAKKAEDAYKKLLTMANNNADKIYWATKNLNGNDPGTKHPDAPNKTDYAKPPDPPPKPPVVKNSNPPDSTDTGDDSSTPPTDPAKVRGDLQDSQHTKENIDKLIALAQGYKDANDKKARENPDDPWAAGAVADAQKAIDDLEAWRKKINDRMTDDLNQLHPPDDKKSADNAQNHASGSDDDDGGGDIVDALLGPSPFGPYDPFRMAIDQGAGSTGDFIDAISPGNNDSPNSSSGDNRSASNTSKQLKDNTRDAVKDGVRDAATSNVRDSSRSAACPDGH